MKKHTINYSHLLLCTLLMLGTLVGCKKDNVTPSSQKPPVLSMNQLYQNAILDA